MIAIKFVDGKFNFGDHVVKSKMWDYVKNKFGVSKQRKLIKFLVN